MKVREIIDIQINDLFKNAGLNARKIVLTARALEQLIIEMNGQPIDIFRQTGDEDSIYYKDMECVIAELPRFCPICVVASTKDELNLFQLKTRGGQNVTFVP